MAEQTETLKAYKLEGDLKLVLPPEWESLPRTPAETYVDDNYKQHRCKFFSKRCKTEVPTQEDVMEVVSAVLSAGKVVSLMANPGYIVIPSFPEGKDPKVGEFLVGAFDKSTMTKEAVVVIYAHLETK